MKFFSILFCFSVTVYGVYSIAIIRSEVDVCQLPKDTSDCGKDSIQLYYDADTKDCEFFEFGGCEGPKGNRFETLLECRAACVRNVRSEVDVCQLPKDTRDCGKDSIQLYYDADTKDCEFFEFGGCEGPKGNRFETLHECRAACVTNDVWPEDEDVEGDVWPEWPEDEDAEGDVWPEWPEDEDVEGDVWPEWPEDEDVEGDEDVKGDEGEDMDDVEVMNKENVNRANPWDERYSEREFEMI